MILTYGGEKGGTGKTALATNTATCAAMAGMRVLLYDADPQRSSVQWHLARSARPDVAQLPALDCVEPPRDLEPDERGPHLFEELERVRDAYDLIVVDCAGAETSELYFALCHADRLYMPLLPSLADLRTVETIERLVECVREAGNGGLGAIVVLNKCHGMLERDSHVQRTRQALEGRLPVARSLIGFRRPVASAYWEHLAVPELALHADRRVRENAKKAVGEFWTLFEEITGRRRPEEKTRGKRRKRAA